MVIWRERGEMRLIGTSERCFRSMVESSFAAMILVDREGVIQFANAETEHIFGYENEQLLGSSIELLIPAAVRGRHESLRRGFVANPSRRSIAGRDLKAARRDGTEFSAEIGLTPIQTEVGIMVLAMVIDITKRREAEEALAQRAAELEQANEHLARFAYVAAHDLQEPLRKILAFGNLMDEAVASSEQAQIAHASKLMQASAQRAHELVDDLLTLSRMMHVEQNLQMLDLREAIELALIDLSQAIIETNSRINIDVPAVSIRADRSQFTRLLQNIISNAIKYRKPGQSATVNITVDPLDQSTLRLAIADDGIGFEEQYAQKIFEPFQRLHSKTEYPGSGTGLAICKAIADRHGWRISVKAQPGEGATFFIAFPKFS